jgi:hypothetical protein
MKVCIIISLLVSMYLTSLGQRVVKISRKDSIQLNLAWNKFKKGLMERDTNNLHILSLKLVDCKDCISMEKYSIDDTFVPIDTFLNKAFREFDISKKWTSIKTKNYTILTREIKNYQPKNLNPKCGKDLIIFELWFITMEPNKITGYEGQSHAFQFIKLNNQFKFFGVTSVP